MCCRTRADHRPSLRRLLTIAFAVGCHVARNAPSNLQKPKRSNAIAIRLAGSPRDLSIPLLGNCLPKWRDHRSPPAVEELGCSANAFPIVEGHLCLEEARMSTASPDSRAVVAASVDASADRIVLDRRRASARLVRLFVSAARRSRRDDSCGPGRVWVWPYGAGCAGQPRACARTAGGRVGACRHRRLDRALRAPGSSATAPAGVGGP